MNIQAATRNYEDWLGERTTLVQADLDFTHQQRAVRGDGGSDGAELEGLGANRW